jgi:hypothetical protein
MLSQVIILFLVYFVTSEESSAYYPSPCCSLVYPKHLRVVKIFVPSAVHQEQRSNRRVDIRPSDVLLSRLIWSPLPLFVLPRTVPVLIVVAVLLIADKIWRTVVTGKSSRSPMGPIK